MSSDLHTHTTFSDGKLTPEELINLAKTVGLKYLAITDHDTVDGIGHLYESGLFPARGINIIPGIEFSARHPSSEIHILGYNIDIYHRAMAEKLNEVTEARWTRFSLMIEKLKQMGYNISETDVLTLAGTSKAVGRSHIARAMVKKGYFSSLREVFDNLLERGKPAYEPHYRLEVSEIIEIIKMAGGTPVLAHPKLIGDNVLVEELCRQGIEGIEAFYPLHDEADTAYYVTLAQKHSLIITGGSDFHGSNSGRHPIELGKFTIDDCWAEKIFKPEKNLG
jgi:hypothetical protein